MANKKKELAKGINIGKKAVEDDKNKQEVTEEMILAKAKENPNNTKLLDEGPAPSKDKKEKKAPKKPDIRTDEEKEKDKEETKKQMENIVDKSVDKASQPMNEFHEREEMPEGKFEEAQTKAEAKYNSEPLPIEEETNGEEFQIGEELQKKLFETDEGQIAEEAIETGDISELENIVDPDTNEPFILPTYDKDGRVTALKDLVPENAELYSKKTGIFLTVLSIVVSALSGGIIPPVNFINMRWDDAKNKEAALQNEVIRLYNGEIDDANKKLIETRGTEQALSSAQNKELYNEENSQDLARAKAAEQGNTGLEQTKISADLQKALQENQLNVNIEMLKLNNQQQKDMAELLYDQEVQKFVNQIKTMRENGLSTDDIAKYASSVAGNTNVGRFMNYFGQGTQGAANLVNSILPMGSISDKNVKKFDARPVNNTMLKSAFKWR